MHDPMTVAFEIKRPWPTPRDPQFKGWRYWPALVTVWHVDPERDGSDDSCGWHRQRPWWSPRPRWHVHHWSIRIHFIQDLKRWLFSRCHGCKRRMPWGYAPVTYSWDSDGPRWFRGERGVYHHGCLPSALGQGKGKAQNPPSKAATVDQRGERKP